MPGPLPPLLPGCSEHPGLGSTQWFGAARGDWLQPVSWGGFGAVWAEGTLRAARPPELQRYIDGALSNDLPFVDSPSTITVSPFHGTVDICPQSSLASMHELNAFNATFQICTKNFFLGVTSSPEVGRDPVNGLEGVRGLAVI